MVLKRFALLGFIAVLLFAQTAFAAVYEIDPEHTSIGFKIRHLFTNVRGTFDEYEGTIEYEPGKPDTWKAEATIQAASINTKVKERDKHLRSADFFDVEKYPSLIFKSTKVTEATENAAKLEGMLTVHGVEKPVVLDLEIHGAGKDPWGNVRAGFTATTKINRKDFGLTWNQAVETGGVLVGDEVEITLEIEAKLKEAPAKA
jgi:polyisoprenoid-binding protein YceI